MSVYNFQVAHNTYEEVSWATAFLETVASLDLGVTLSQSVKVIFVKFLFFNPICHGGGRGGRISLPHINTANYAGFCIDNMCFYYYGDRKFLAKFFFEIFWGNLPFGPPKNLKKSIFSRGPHMTP